MEQRGAAGAQAPPLFREVQRFRMWVFWLPVTIVTGVVWWQFVEQAVLGRPQGSEPLPNWAAWLLALIFGLGFPAFAVLLRLITEVRTGELLIRLFPFRSVRIPLAEVTSAEAREYSPLREFGGWGVRIGPGGKAYSAYGAMGVQLVLQNQKRILIGSQRPVELVAALRQAGAKVP
jgi:hypothetical protein